MSQKVTVSVPNIGDATDVEVIEVLVAKGDRVEAEDSLITLESDKASMEIPAPEAGVVDDIFVKVGDKVSEGTAILSLDVETVSGTTEKASEATPASTSSPVSSTASSSDGDGDTAQNERVEVLVIGGGPGGYTAAFRAADLGKEVVLVERYDQLGGVCLNVGCIPSKALLHVAHSIEEAAELADSGVAFNTPEIDLAKLRQHKEKVVGQLTGGLAALAKKRKVRVIQGRATLSSANSVLVEQGEESTVIHFEQAIIAAGSHNTQIPGFPYDDPRLIDSTGALALQDIPKRMLVIGGGIIGLEMASVYSALGTSVTVVELANSLIPGCDPDLVKPLQQRISTQYENIFLQSKVTRIEPEEHGLKVWFEGDKTPEHDTFDRVLLAVGRRPNGLSMGAEAGGVHVDEQGFIPVDRQQRTNVPHIFAVGDIVGQPMLAHKATHEAKVAAEVIAGHKAFFDARVIPSVAYTQPEIAWAGLTETQAKGEGVAYEKASFPWAASGRSLSMGRKDGLTKVLYDPETRVILGVGIVGSQAGELIAEAALAIEMGADTEDLALTIHPHPTLSETINFAAEVAEGSVTDIYAPKRK